MIDEQTGSQNRASAGAALTVPATQPTARRLLADLALLGVAIVWGSTFVMVKEAVASYPVFGFLAVRFLCAALPFVPFVLLRGRGLIRASSLSLSPLLPPLFIGLALFAGYAFQTLGLKLTTPAKTGFITGLYVVIVPLVAALVLRQAPGRNAWLGVGLAMIGLGLLSFGPGLSISPGDALVFGCALAYAVHILLTGRYAPYYDPFWLTLGQILVMAALSGGAALAFEARIALSGAVLFAAAFTGLLATAAAFGIQTVAQRFTTPTHTALILGTEPVFAAVASLALTGERLGARQIAGCGLILAGMMVAEWRSQNGGRVTAAAEQRSQN